MRTMIYLDDIKLNVVEHIMLVNGWEYYIVDPETPADYDDRYKFALVMGFATELGDIDLEEIKPYILSRSSELYDIEPGNKCRWA